MKAKMKIETTKSLFSNKFFYALQVKLSSVIKFSLRTGFFIA